MFTPESGIGVALGFLIGLIAHDFAHHRLAARMGDRSPQLSGRLRPSLVAGADPVGTYVFPAIYIVSAFFGNLFVPFGWTKPHAVGTHQFERNDRRTVLVALAGPAATAILAVIVGRIAPGVSSPSVFNAIASAAIVLSSLTIFELLPIPGRDGARILSVFLPPHAAARFADLAQYQVLFMVVLFTFLNPVARSMLQVSCDVLTPLC